MEHWWIRGSEIPKEGDAVQAKKAELTKASEPEKVDAYMAKLKHPLADVVAALRKIILSTDREIGEETTRER